MAGMPNGTKPRKWTPDEVSWLRENVPGTSYADAHAAFCEMFEPVTFAAFNGVLRRNGIMNGLDRRFEKGHETWSKGKTWDEQGRSEESKRRSLSTCFKPGNVPHNAGGKPIGYERVSKDGYIEVKVAERPSRHACNDNFASKHRLVWERANGMPVTEGCNVVFADGDNRNFDPENLVAVPRGIWATICKEGIAYYDAESLRLAMDVARLTQAASAATMHERGCKRCGAAFSPRFANQRTCDACLGRR